jgi:hydroxypyruvate isomerase
MGKVKLSACIEMVFGNTPDFVERIAKSAEAGLPGFEFWGWHGKDLAAIKAKAAELGIATATFCCDAPGALVDPANHDAWVAGARESIAVGADYGIPTLIVTTGNEMDICRCEQHKAIVAGLKAIAPDAEAAGITIVLEPLNILTDHMGYYLSTSKEGFEICREVGSPRVKLLFDIYHQQITEGNLIVNIRNDIDLIGHFHMADVPGRHQPLTGELNYERIFAAIAATDYAGFVGMEFAPTACHMEAVKTTMKLAGDGCCCGCG